MKFFNRVAIATATTGTGTLTFGAAASPKLLTPAEAGAEDEDEVCYLIEDGSDFELGIGTIGGDETTLSRDTVLVSKVSGSAGTGKLDLSGSAVVRLTEPAEFLNSLVTSVNGQTAAVVLDAEDVGAIQSSLLTTRGDLLRRGASAPERFALGTQHQVLLAGANDPEWGALNLAQAVAVTGVLPAGNLPDASTTAEGVSEQAVASEFRTGTDTTRHLGVAETWAAAQSAALSDAATVTVSLAAMLTLAHVVLGGNRTLDFTNLKEGQHFILMVTATGSTRTLTVDAIADLWDGVETGPYSITTSQSLFVCGFVPDGASSVEITAIGRRAT